MLRGQSIKLSQVSEHYNLLGGKTVYWCDVSGKNITQESQDYAENEMPVVPAFCFKMDTALIVNRLEAYIKGQRYALDNVRNEQWRRQRRKELDDLQAELTRLRNKHIKADVAGGVVETICVILLRIKPSQDFPRLFNPWLNLHTLMDEYRTRYSLLSNSIQKFIHA